MCIWLLCFMDLLLRDILDICFEVCVVALDKPWQSYEVRTYTSPVTHMRWDPAGTTLLVVNASGRFSLWRMKVILSNPLSNHYDGFIHYVMYVWEVYNT